MKTTPNRKAGKGNRILLSETKSVCPVCLERIKAQYTADADGVFLEKTCPDHGDFVFLCGTIHLTFSDGRRELLTNRISRVIARTPVVSAQIIYRLRVVYYLR